MREVIVVSKEDERNLEIIKNKTIKILDSYGVTYDRDAIKLEIGCSMYYESTIQIEYKGLQFTIHSYIERENFDRDLNGLFYSTICDSKDLGFKSAFILSHYNKKLRALFEKHMDLCSQCVHLAFIKENNESRRKILKIFDMMAINRDKILKEIKRMKKSITFYEYATLTYYEGYDLYVSICGKDAPIEDNIKRTLFKIKKFKHDANLDWLNELKDLGFKIKYINRVD